MLLTAVVITAACTGSGTGDDDGDDDDGGPDPSETVFDPGKVSTFDIALPAESVAALQSDPETYVRGALTVDGETVADIGVRLKGEWNFRPLGMKAAFKLKFDELVPGQTFRGLRRLVLNNVHEDPSWVAERLTYHAFRSAGLPAPRAASVWVTVNGEAYGLYTVLEAEDKTFLRRWFDDVSGNLYEENMEDLVVGNEGAFELETNELANDKSDLTALFAAVAAADDETLLEDLAAVLDGPAFLRYCAYEAAVLQWDGYCQTRFGPNNFRLYHDPSTGHFHFIPWGMDMSWKSYEPDALDPFDARSLLFQKCLNGASCRAAYEAEVRATADRIDALGLPALVDTWGAQVRPHVMTDPKKEVDMDRFEEALADVRAHAEARAAELRAARP
ncbi:MAG TPA: CotH kinase family protein [Kofleriaceae bacterium]|nr:CotH kinase family protein [Kofleriaceae bacterium]